MRRTIPFALMIGLLAMLTACSSRSASAEEKFYDLRQTLQSKQEVCMTGDVTADFGDSTSSYTLRYTSDAEEKTVEVLAPELIAGVKAKISGSASSVEYDGLMLDAGILTADGQTPVSALPAVCAAIESGYVESIWEEELDGTETVAVKLPISDEVSITVWIDSASSVPRYAEISSDGRVAAFCRITDWSTD